MPKLEIEDVGTFDVEERREAWRGESCCTALAVVGGDYEECVELLTLSLC